MTKPIITVSNISKSYALSNRASNRRTGYKRLSEEMLEWPRRALLSFRTSIRQVQSNAEVFWALKDLNFEVNQGDVVGVIGRNGAGKSTLLKILSRITEPTSGRITLRGRVASLLEVGTGFHPELTGRENIFLNGSILGMTRREIRKKFDEIVDFAGVEKFLDTSVKRYSSGMYVRLAFAVAAHLDPEILIVDEVLAVGDAEFQRKCLGKMKEVSSQNGKTVLFVSHNLGVVSQICKTGIVLANGQIVFAGMATDACRNYSYRADDSQATSVLQKQLTGNKALEFTEASIRNAASDCVAAIDYGEEAYLRLEYFVSRPGTSYSISAEVQNLESGVVLTSTSLDSRPLREQGDYPEQGYYVADLKLPTDLLREGKYEVRIAATIPCVEILDEFPSTLMFEVNDLASPVAVLGEGRRGVILPRLDWTIRRQAIATQ